MPFRTSPVINRSLSPEAARDALEIMAKPIDVDVFCSWIRRLCDCNSERDRSR
jgi:hypothetical protein